ncbi:MAG: hypothetical protein JNM56_16480, partial [Planctomycetia bacterium]|nr:hypothetical protein [Planctomycetia bacterium]
IDADPERPVKGIPSTDAEKSRAEAVILLVQEHLAALGWPAPVLADSGNGYHLLYAIDLPADDGGTVERCLKALAAEFDTDAVKIDQTVFNPARICKLYGTAARKGDDHPARPHRVSRILEVPESWK